MSNSNEKKDNSDIEIDEILETAEAASKDNMESADENISEPSDEINIEELDDDKSEDSVDESEEEEELDLIVAAEVKVKESNDKYLRLMAEFDNFKKRTAVEYGRMIESANRDLMVDIIEVRETLQKALTPDAEHDDFESFKEGVRLIYNKLEEHLTKHGLESFGEVNDKFDPALHDAMMKQPHDEIEEDHIVQIFERGYKLKENIIKHAKVVVSDGNA